MNSTPATAKQIAYLLSLASKSQAYDATAAKAVSAARYGNLSKSAASAAIDFYRQAEAADDEGSK